MKYPQYRKYKNGKSYFRILSPSGFDEIQALGGRWFLYHFEARLLPDRNLIHDMTFDYEGNWDVITEEAFREIYSKVSIPPEA